MHARICTHARGAQHSVRTPPPQLTACTLASREAVRACKVHRVAAFAPHLPPEERAAASARLNGTVASPASAAGAAMGSCAASESSQVRRKSRSLVKARISATPAHSYTVLLLYMNSPLRR
jgi:hypothetical protein